MSNLSKAHVYKLSKEEIAKIGTKCPHCGVKYQKADYMDLRDNAPKEKSYYLWCLCLHPGDGILGSSIF